MKKDILHSIFEKHMMDLSRPHQTQEEMIFDVVAAYIFHLMELGNIPHHVLDLLETDLTEEVTDIYRKKTYGFLNLQEYRNSRVRKTY